jgi:hypothetical protein
LDYGSGHHNCASDDPRELELRDLQLEIRAWRPRGSAAIFGLLVVALAFGQGKRTFTGVITDSMCENGDHSHMKMGSNDAECTIACVEAHGASYVLWDGKNSYTLSDQKTPETFAGKRVTVTGTLDSKKQLIQVDSIAAAK